jgi:small subunit ribosomal protein S11
MAATKKTTMRKKKTYRPVPHAKIYIQSSFNNTIVSVTDATGNVLSWSSSGHAGFKGARKATPYAAKPL